DCSKLKELEAAGVELLAVMKAKSKYTLAKLDAALAGGSKPIAQGQSVNPPPAAVAKADQAPPKPVSKSKAQSWSAQTKAEPRPHPAKPTDAGVPSMEPGPSVAMLEPGPPDEPGYTIDEIREISRGFFGTISTELGSVIEYAFSNAGRPDGYVLGTEGGGAFLAGLRYGTGTLYMRAGGSSKIYWHGPSIGTDVGAAGSRTMFLIYRMQQPDDLYRQFTGVDGSAYFIGGVGITFLKGGPVMMAPIRTGLGFRIGANIGYIRFTPRATWNPF
ncbi:MAG TPA: EipA family protein, partial [Hyphomicrobium sp.]|nr:EipA family protein [Hyphomicrobium sp.]